MYCWSRKCTRQAAILGFLELCPARVRLTGDTSALLSPPHPLSARRALGAGHGAGCRDSGRRRWALRSPAVSFDEALPSGALGAQARPMQQEDHPGRGTGHTQESIVQHAEELGGA